MQTATVAAEIIQTWAATRTRTRVSSHHHHHDLRHPDHSSFIPPHVIWSLRVVARAGISLSDQSLKQLLPALMLLLVHPTCSAYVAATAAYYSNVDPQTVVRDTLVRMQNCVCVCV
jgi:hypothetical protein